MQKYRLPLIREVPIPSDEEANLPQPIAYYYRADEVDAEHSELIEHNVEANAHIAELESALRLLLEDTQHVNHNCGDSADYCPVLNARLVLQRRTPS